MRSKLVIKDHYNSNCYTDIVVIYNSCTDEDLVMELKAEQRRLRIIDYWFRSCGSSLLQ